MLPLHIFQCRSRGEKPGPIGMFTGCIGKEIVIFSGPFIFRVIVHILIKQAFHVTRGSGVDSFNSCFWSSFVDVLDQFIQIIEILICSLILELSFELVLLLKLLPITDIDKGLV